MSVFPLPEVVVPTTRSSPVLPGFLAILLLHACDGGTAAAPEAGLREEPHARSLVFTMPSSFVEVPDAPSLDLEGRWTLEAWIKPANPAGSFQHILSKWNGAGDASYTLEVNAGHLRVAVHDGISPSQAVESFGILTPASWQHVAATFRSGRLRLYINGSLDRVVEGVLTPMNSTRPLSIGHEGPPFNGWQYSGGIDEVRVWRIERTPRDIARSAMAPLTGRESGLVGYWRFDEGEGQWARDRSRYGNHGRLGSSEAPDPDDPAWTEDVPPFRR